MAEATVARVEGMIQWAQSNHLLIVFHSQDSNTVSNTNIDKQFFYRSKDVRALQEP